MFHLYTIFDVAGDALPPARETGDGDAPEVGPLVLPLFPYIQITTRFRYTKQCH